MEEPPSVRTASWLLCAAAPLGNGRGIMLYRGCWGDLAALHNRNTLLKQSFFNHRYDNGLTLVAESMPSLESAALSILVPAGCAYDPADRLGLSTLTCEMVLRGRRQPRQPPVCRGFGKPGCACGESVSASHTSFGAATLASNLPAALAIYADVLRRPHLPADQMEAGRMVAVQELRAIEDDPSHKVMLETRRRHYPEPWGRPSEGEMKSLEAISHDEVREGFETLYRPNGTIIGVAGNIEWPLLQEHVGELLGDWAARDVPAL